MLDQTSELSKLRVKLDEAHARIHELERALGQWWCPPTEFNLTPTEAKILGLLYKRVGVVARETIVDVLYNGRPFGRTVHLKTTDQFVMRIRQKCGPYGITVKNVWSIGWVMPPEGRARLKEMEEGK